jgi:FkbM family methyltransferase
MEHGSMQFPRFRTQYDWQSVLERNAPQNFPRPKAGFFTNWVGVITDIELYSNRADYKTLSEHVFSKMPIPNDQHHVDADEYGSIFLAIENRAETDKLVIVEVGAAWGPWISAGAIIAKRIGIKKIDLVGVEAESVKFEYLRQHMAHNNLINDKDISISLIFGAAWTSNEKVYFGADTNFTDYGAAATDQHGDSDYRGRQINFAETQGYTLETIIGDRAVVDYLAMDIQGSEYTVLKKSIDILNSRVRFISVGTHSPAIHGNLIELFFNNRWQVIWDKYPVYDYDLGKPDLRAMTTIDGELLLVNRNLVGNS